MALKTLEIISIALSALAAGMFCGPWLALTRSISTFEPEVFLTLTRRLSQNMAGVMTVLFPAAMLSMVPVAVVSYPNHPHTCYLSLAGLALFIVTLIVTMQVEVPIVRQIEACTPATLPANWEQLRDRWGAFHIVRVTASFGGLVLLLIGAIS